MTIKEIVEKYWRDFEVIAFKAVKNTLPKDLIIHEKLTQAIKDGGYDGEFILSSNNNSLLQIVFEAKLRSNTKADLPLKEFAKSLVIAIVRQADIIYIVTNLHFSKETMSLLERYADSVPLNIQLLNGYSVKEFIRTHGNMLDGIHVELRDFLFSQEDIQCEQTLHSKVFCQNSFSTLEELGLSENYSIYADIFDRRKGMLLVTGKVGSGKSYYIEHIHRVLKIRNKTAYLIDLSTCLTYKDLFLEIISKTLGLSLELVDLMDEQAFIEAFSKIGVSTADEDDIRMLKYLFARENKYPYDYSVLFSQITNFYYKIFCISQRKNKVIVSFLNLVYAQNEVLQLLLSFLKNENAFSSILEIASDDFWENDIENWATVKQNLVRISTFQPYVVKDWGIVEAKQFLRKNITGLSEEQLNMLVKKFGRTPGELSNLVELINYSNLYANVPKELIYQEIFALTVTKGEPIYCKCLEFMQFANSDILYIYAFVYLLCGEVPLDFLSQYFPDKIRLEKCLSILARSNLFEVNTRKISIKNAKIEDFFQLYCEKIYISFPFSQLLTLLKCTMIGFISRPKSKWS